MLDEALTENKRQLKQRYPEFGQQQRTLIEDGRFKLNLLKCRIDELRADLTSRHYKHGIIEILSNDMMTELTTAIQEIQQALNGFQERVYLKVNVNILETFER